MPVYLCGQSALDVTRYLRATNEGQIPGRSARPRSLTNAVCTNRQLNELDHSAELLLSHVQGKIHLFVADRASAHATSRIVPHVWTHPLCRGMFINLGNDIFLSTPGFLFLQLAATLDTIELAIVGMELCGFYSHWKMQDFRVPNTMEEEHRNCTFELKPTTSTTRLTQFLERMKGERGIKRARQALKLVLDCAASPMEIATYLLLSLPRSQGGWGLPKPKLNTKVTVSTGTHAGARFPDLYWPESNLDVEYQSDFAHSGMYSRYRDSRRLVELAAKRVVVLPLTREQLMDPDGFVAFATSVRRCLNKRSRTPPHDWYGRYLDLRAKLLP